MTRQKRLERIEAAAGGRETRLFTHYVDDGGIHPAGTFRDSQERKPTTKKSIDGLAAAGARCFILELVHDGK